MLNGWMNKAKHLAADLDQQLNESVGMDPNGTASTTNAGATFVSDQNVVGNMKTSTDNNAVVANPSTVVNLNENDDDDAWNDDFDFGDDDVADVDIIDAVKERKISVSSTTLKGTTKQTTNPQDTEEQILELSSTLEPEVPTATKTTKKVDTMSPLIPSQNNTITSTATTIPIRSVEVSRKSAPSIKLSTTTDKTSDTLSKTATYNDDAMTTSISPDVPAAGSISIPKDGEGIGGGLFSLAQKMTTEVATGRVTSLFTTLKATSKLGEGENTDDNEIKKNDRGDFVASTSTEVNGTPSVDNKISIGWDEDTNVIDDDNDDGNDGLNAISTKNVVLDENSQSGTNMATNNTADNSANFATTPKTSGGGLLSNFSNLAQTADTLLVAAAQLGGGDSDSDGEEDVVILNKNKQDQQKQKELEEISHDSKISDDDSGSSSAPINDSVPSIKLSKNKSLPSPMLSTPSYAVSAVDTPLGSVAAEPHDSSNNKNNITRKSTNNHRKSSKWEDEDEDVDGLLVLVEDNDSNKDTDDSVNEGKAESKAILSNQTPPPRHEVAVLRNSNTNVVENEASSSYSDVKLSLPSSIPTTEASSQQQQRQQQQQQQQQSRHLEVKLLHNPPSGEDITPTIETITTAPSIAKISTPIVMKEDDLHFKQLQETLRLREEQLVDKGGQLNELQSLLETRDQQYKQKLNDTKEEAKKRILRAKERCEVAEAKIQARSSDQVEDSSKQQLIIEELREEGQALAMKQSAMEQSVRAAKAETRSLTEALQQEAYEKEDALGKIIELEKELKCVKASLNSAREGESQAGKLESDLLAARADAEVKNNTILINLSRMKELTAESKELKSKIDITRKSAAHVQQQEKTSMLREHSDLIGDLELKLRTTEREAGVREDALRHEVAEIRKRWQDAVRRADSLSMDMQSSTAPLLRQLESMERQSRLRTVNAAELESRLRFELEEATIESETLVKNCSELKSKLMRLERSIKKRDEELVVAREMTEEQTVNITKLKQQQEKLMSEAEERQIEYEKVERLANEGVSRVRSEMTQTVIDSEERYRGQIDKMQKELKIEEEKRNQMEDQVGQLFETTGGVFASSQSPQFTGIRRESKPKKLHKAEGQAEILAGALGLGDDSDDNDTDDDDDHDDAFDLNDMDLDPSNRESFNSFAALEQLSSKLRSADVELKLMRKSLNESNETRQSMVEELGETRHAKEKLPLFEFKVKELSHENQEMEREIIGLKEDIADVRELYRTQLNVLLEEKISSSSAAEIPLPPNNVNQDENNSSGVDR